MPDQIHDANQVEKWRKLTRTKERLSGLSAIILGPFNLSTGLVSYLLKDSICNLIFPLLICFHFVQRIWQPDYPPATGFFVTVPEGFFCYSYWCEGKRCREFTDFRKLSTSLMVLRNPAVPRNFSLISCCEGLRKVKTKWL